MPSPPPGGESLKDTGARVWPYYLHDDPAARHARRERAYLGARQFAPRADHGAGGLTPEEIVKRELETGLPILYRLNADTTVAEKAVLAA